MTDYEIKNAYQVRRRLPSPNVVTRIPTLRPIPAISPIGFKNIAKPNPKAPQQRTLRLGESPIIKDVRKIFKDKQEVEQSKAEHSATKVKELTKAVTTSAESRLEAARANIQRERESLAEQQKQMKEMAEASATPEVTADPAVDGFVNSLASLTKQIPKLKRANTNANFYKDMNAYKPVDWDENINKINIPQDTDALRSNLYSPFARDLATSFIGTRDLSPDFKKQFQLTGIYGRRPQAPEINIAQLLSQLGMGQRLY